MHPHETIMGPGSLTKHPCTLLTHSPGWKSNLLCSLAIGSGADLTPCVIGGLSIQLLCYANHVRNFGSRKQSATFPTPTIPLSSWFASVS